MALTLSRVQNVSNRSEPRRINAVHRVEKNEPDSSALDGAIQPARVHAPSESLTAWMAREFTLGPRASRGPGGGP